MGSTMVGIGMALTREDFLLAVKLGVVVVKEFGEGAKSRLAGLGEMGVK